ncbi:glycosyltransferase [Paenibacillus sp. MAHUQ-46]|uniref:Glycosyltransferase n=1 Tax=Paenibacillus roseus TaxID=2798579 RepID=A0A934J3P0_9BACL|nr:glycosyltransferase [Paenibacillus roseus]
MRVAIVHDYLNQMGGAERVVAVFRRLFPDAPIYTTIVDEKKLLPELKGASIRTTWMQHIPGIQRYFKLFFWLYPFAVRSVKLDDYDLVISSSSAYAKGVRKPKHAVHVCYCHTPMRFAWDFDTYMNDVSAPGWAKKLSKLTTGLLRRWDRRNSRDVDLLIANSTIVRQRIRDCYDMASDLIFPPVDVDRFEKSEPVKPPEEDYFLVVSRLVSYKRIDLAVKACSAAGKKLIIIGSGPDKGRLQAMAGSTVQFMGRLSDEEVTGYMAHCKALLFPGIEDFGITPLEANACGRPVIAFRGGGALDTIREGLNGLFFDRQTPDSLKMALERLEGERWNQEIIREYARGFNEQRFIAELRQRIEQTLDKKQAVRRPAARISRQRQERA